MDIIKSWNNGAPYLGSNLGIDPGQTQYWHNGIAFLNIYSPINSFLFSSIAEVSTASITSIAEVPIANIARVAGV